MRPVSSLDARARLIGDVGELRRRLPGGHVAPLGDRRAGGRRRDVDGAFAEQRHRPELRDRLGR